MITALDHVVLIAPEAEAQHYVSLLGRGIADLHEYDDGRRNIFTMLDNVVVETFSPFKAGSGADRLNELLSEDTRFASLAFATDDLDAAHRRAERRGLNPGDCHEGITADYFRCDDAVCSGVKTFIVEQKRHSVAERDKKDQVSRLDHLVINTPNPERALAHYGARLGLRLALDREMPQFGARMMFFKAGDVTIEVIHRLDQDHYPGANDKLWGLSWEVPDLKAAHARLTKDNITVSEIRTGRKSGTEVFTVKSHNLGVPTLFIGKTPG